MPAAVRGVLMALLAGAAGACEVEWGGARVALEDPAPVDTVVPETEGPRPVAPLPEGPLLYHLRAAQGGRVLATPVAEWDPATGPDTLAWPSNPDPEWRARFDSTFLARGTELGVLSRTSRVGSVVLEGDAAPGSGPGCPSRATARWLLVPDVAPPDEAWAVPLHAVGALPAPPPATELADRIRTFGPILAENLLRAAGESRPWLAQRADIRAVPFEGDQAPAMAATYLIGDELGAPPPQGEAVSLFYLARYAPARGYYPIWREVRRYGGGAEREAFAWRDALPLAAGGRVEILTRYGAAGTRLAAGIAGDGEAEAIGITWVETTCPVLGAAGRDAAAAAGAAGPARGEEAPRRDAGETTAGAAATGNETAAPTGTDTPAAEGAVPPATDTGAAVTDTGAAGPDGP